MFNNLKNVNVLASRVYAVLAVLFIFFIMLASWTPGYSFRRGQTPGSDPFYKEIYEGSLRLLHWPTLQDIYSFHELRDLATNVVLYIPLGVLVALAAGARKARWFSPWIGIGLFVSLSMELVQSKIGRYPDPVDVMTNSTGFLFGYWLIVAAIKFFGLNPAYLTGLAPAGNQGLKLSTVTAVRFIYICIFIFVAWLPLDITVSFSRIHAKFFPDDVGNLRIILNPLFTLRHWPEEGGRIFLEFLSFLPLSFLTSLKEGWQKRLNPFSPILQCLLLAVFVESTQIFINTKTSDITTFFLAVLAGLTGWLAAKIWFNFQKMDEEVRVKSFENKRRMLQLILILYILGLYFFAWAPFLIETQPEMVIHKIVRESNLIPFKSHFEVRNFNSALDLVKETALFIPLGVLFSLAFKNYFNPLAIRFLPLRKLFRLIGAENRIPLSPMSIFLKRIFLIGGSCGILAVMIELSQTFFIGRIIDITDVILAVLGGGVGSALTGLMSTEKG